MNCVNLGKHPILSISTAGNYQLSQLTQLQQGGIVLSPIELCNTWESNSDFNKLLFISTIKDRTVSVGGWWFLYIMIALRDPTAHARSGAIKGAVLNIFDRAWSRIDRACAIKNARSMRDQARSGAINARSGAINARSMRDQCAIKAWSLFF